MAGGVEALLGPVRVLLSLSLLEAKMRTCFTPAEAFRCFDCLSPHEILSRPAYDTETPGIPHVIRRAAVSTGLLPREAI